MAFDFSKIRAGKTRPRPVDPIDIFHSCTVSDQNINDLWLAQGDALREWHTNRDSSDVGIVLNTGAGKTLVGLLVAQSLVNETSGHVLYACSSIQLIRQTAEKASGYGLTTTTYHRGEFSNDDYLRGLAPCITTYQALFNGKSKFFRDQIAAVVFDDAHAAEHLLRDHFSLSIKRSSRPNLYTQLHSLFRDYHYEIGRASSYDSLGGDRSDITFLVPPFIVCKNAAEIRRLFGAEGLDGDVETMFAWEHIRDREDLCCVLVSDDSITLTPPIVPVDCLPYFGKEVRRVYLSATLAAPDAFVRTFGREPQPLIAPSTTAGECERLILFPSRSGAGGSDTELAAKLVDDQKTLLLVPTYSRAKEWQHVAKPPDREAVADAVASFRDAPASSAPKLLLAARYDGVDFPGDTCRVMVIDDLPMGSGPLERYLWGSLGLSNSLRSTLASRIVQSFGRISRGMSDHGVVVITGDRLVEWLLVPKNVGVLPGFLRRQIDLGYEVSTSAGSLEDLASIVSSCLQRDPDWVRTYTDFMDSEEEEPVRDTAPLVQLALAEAAYMSALWNREYESAAGSLAKTLELAFQVSANTGAWHSLWLGYALQKGGDGESALEMYSRAHGAQSNIPPVTRSGKDECEQLPSQITKVDRQISVGADGTVRMPKTLQTDLSLLDGSGTAFQTEEALRCLGQYLGFCSSRPDKEFATGPDVLWLADDGTALCMEAKTNKKESSQYQKDDLGQLADHVQWVRDKTAAKDIYPVIVGPLVPATSSANPGPEVLVVELSAFADLAKRLVSALTDATNDSLPLTLRSDLMSVFSGRGLLWPKVFDSMPKTPLREISG